MDKTELKEILNEALKPLEEQLLSNTQAIQQLLKELESSGNDAEPDKSQQLLESLNQRLISLNQSLVANNKLQEQLLTVFSKLSKSS